MADRYWVGGTGTWNTTSTTNWSATSGGASGASVPTVADNVFFDQAGTYTVTMTGALACLDITVSAGTVTFATGTTPTLNVRGSMSLLAGTVWSSTGTITFSSTTTGRTVTTNGVTLSGAVTFNGTGGGWTLGSALTTSSICTVSAGTFDTSSASNYALTCTRFSITGTLTRTVNLNASTITITIVSSTALDAATITGLTFNSGTSQINLTSDISGISSGGLTFYNVAFNSLATGRRDITGINTFNNLSCTASSLTGLVEIRIYDKQTINGTFSTVGTAGNRRISFNSATYGSSIDLVVNGSTSLTDADFRSIYVSGTAAPISGTRIGNKGECRGITFSAPKTVYWNYLGGTQNWASNAWATTPTGTTSTDNFPLPQDIATFTNSGSAGTINVEGSMYYLPTVDMSSRTSAMTINFTSLPVTVYGNWINGSGTSITGTTTCTFAGGTTQTITSAGKTFSCPIVIDTYGGTVKLADAFSSTSSITVTNGTLDTQNYAVTCTLLNSNNSNVRTITLGSSAIAVTDVSTPLVFTTTTNLTFNAGTSSITNSVNVSGTATVQMGALTYYNVTFTNASTTLMTRTLQGAATFNNLTFGNTASIPSLHKFLLGANITVNGTLTCTTSDVTRRIAVFSSSLSTQRTITANAISGADFDFQDINLAGAAAGSSPTRAGNCGNNSGITFPAAKTVYWNFAGTQNWGATAWATSSGGTPAVNNFPLAQDTAVFDNTGAAGTVTIDREWNIGAISAGSRTNAMTLSATASALHYGSLTLGTGITATGLGLIFAQYSNITLTTNGVTIGNNIQMRGRYPNKLTLGDALTTNSQLQLGSGVFESANYNITAPSFRNTTFSSGLLDVYMGSSTWTATGTGLVWDWQNGSPNAFTFPGTSNIVLSDNSTTARSMFLYQHNYNKITIGGNTSTSTTTLEGTNFGSLTVGELTSTKTVAHTVVISSSSSSGVWILGKWSISGSSGNVVTVTGNSRTIYHTNNSYATVDYLNITGFSLTGTQLFVGANSTNVSGNSTQVVFTAVPAARTLYWVGGTGNWSDTARWSTSSGGASGAAVPTSVDDVIFDTASNATAYTATINTFAFCNAITINGPASGAVTVAGSSSVIPCGNVTLQAAGTVTWSNSSTWFLMGTNKSITLTTNGMNFNANSQTINQMGYGMTVTLGSALTTYAYQLYAGTFTTNNYNVTLPQGFGGINYLGVGTTVNFGSSTVNASNSNTFTFNSSRLTTTNFGTSTLVINANNFTLSSNISTYYNVTIAAGTSPPTITIPACTFNNLRIEYNASYDGIGTISVTGDLTINGTFTCTTPAVTKRNRVTSSSLGVQRTLTCAATSITDTDFCDIVIAGAAAPAATTRGGDMGNNSGITFPASKTVYWNLAGAQTWTSNGWATTSGGAPAVNNFPLPQDNVIFDNTGAAGTITLDTTTYPVVNTLDMSARTTAMTLSMTAGTYLFIGKDIKLSSSVTCAGPTFLGIASIIFYGTQAGTITSNGVTWPNGGGKGQILIGKHSAGSVTLADALQITTGSAGTGVLSGTAQLLWKPNLGTFNTASYNVTCTNLSIGGTFTLGSSTITISNPDTGQDALWSNASATINKGTANIIISGVQQSSVRLNGKTVNKITLGGVGGAGSGQVDFSTENRIDELASTRTVACTITGGTNANYITNWTASGTAGNLLTVSGGIWISATGNVMSASYLNLTGATKAYPVFDKWYGGTSSTNSGSLGWLLQAPPTIYASTIAETATITEQIISGLSYSAVLNETATGTDAIAALATFSSLIAESVTGTDLTSALGVFGSVVVENATATDQPSALMTFVSSVSDLATGTDQILAGGTFNGAVNETSSITDLSAAQGVLQAVIQETGAGNDQINALGTFNALLVETSTTTDAAAANINAVATINELSTVTDAVLGSYLWNLITTTPSSSWNLVPSDSFNIEPAWTSSATNGEITIAMLRQPYRNGGYVYSSQDGPWTYRQIASLSPYVFINQTAFVNGKFYAWSTDAPYNQIYRSVDGLNWTEFQPPNPSSRVRSVFGNGSQLIIQHSSAAIYASTDDGMTWSTGSTPSTPSPSTGAVWDGSKYVYNTGRGILTSTDGLTWTARAGFSIAGGAAKGSIAFINGTYYAVQQKTSTNVQPEKIKSTDGITWTANIQGLPAYSLMVFPFGNKFAFAAAGPYTYGNLTYVTLDSITGEIKYLGSVSGAAIDSLVFANFAPSFYKGKFVLPMFFGAAGENEIATSSDLLTFVRNGITELGAGDDNQSPGWQNISV